MAGYNIPPPETFRTFSCSYMGGIGTAYLSTTPSVLAGSASNALFFLSNTYFPQIYGLPYTYITATKGTFAYSMFSSPEFICMPRFRNTTVASPVTIKECLPLIGCYYGFGSSVPFIGSDSSRLTEVTVEKFASCTGPFTLTSGAILGTFTFTTLIEALTMDGWIVHVISNEGNLDKTYVSPTAILTDIVHGCPLHSMIQYDGCGIIRRYYDNLADLSRFITGQRLMNFSIS